jgi:hypothetical protein
MLSVQRLPLKESNPTYLELKIEPIEGFEKGLIQLHNVTIFKTPSGTILIYAHED